MMMVNYTKLLHHKLLGHTSTSPRNFINTAGGIFGNNETIFLVSMFNFIKDKSDVKQCVRLYINGN